MWVVPGLLERYCRLLNWFVVTPEELECQ
jgi:hypothetical protein